MKKNRVPIKSAYVKWLIERIFPVPRFCPDTICLAIFSTFAWQ